MKFKASQAQRKVISLLLDKYENSKTYKGENQVRQTFAIVPEMVMQEYNSDFADVENIQVFEAQLEELVREKFISLQKRGGVIQKILLNTERISDCYETLNREDKNSLIQQHICFFESYLGKASALTKYCMEQIELLKCGYKAEYSIEDATELFSLCLFILANQKELLERELSIVQLGDSKLFEKKFRSRVCRLLQKYGDYEDVLEGIDDKREKEQIILGEHSIYSNPSYLYIKGNATLYFKNCLPVKIYPDMPVAYSSESLQKLERIEIHCPQIMTVENLTAFNRMKGRKYFYLFLSGYHNTAKQRLLMRIAEQNEEIEWVHFGDFDPDGFLIIEHLKKKTGIAFQPMHMGVDELEKYKKYGRPMKENDIRKAEIMVKKKMYVDEMNFMLEQNCKIEQEIVSWMLEMKYDE